MEQHSDYNKPCEHCGKMIVIPETVFPSVAKRRRFCSSNCVAFGRWDKYRKTGVFPKRTPPRPLPNGEKYKRPGRTRAAIAAYLANPKLCKGCGAPIPLPPGKLPSDLDGRTYCTDECSMKHRKLAWEGKGNKFWDIDKMSMRHRMSTEVFLTLAEIDRKRLTRHAQKVYRSAYPENDCQICGCTLPVNVDVAHVKAVATFPKTATLCEVNQLNNLIGACMTCHRLYDRGLITEAEIKQKIATRRPRFSECTGVLPEISSD